MRLTPHLIRRLFGVILRRLEITPWTCRVADVGRCSRVGSPGFGRGRCPRNPVHERLRGFLEFSRGTGRAVPGPTEQGLGETEETGWNLPTQGLRCSPREFLLP